MVFPLRVLGLLVSLWTSGRGNDVVSEKPVKVTSLSFGGDFSASSSSKQLLNWIQGGSSQWRNQKVELLKERTNTFGSIFSLKPVQVNSFSIELFLKIEGSEVARDTEGTAVWLTEADSVLDLTSALEHANLSGFYGFKPNFKGIGIFFAVVKTKENPAPVLSVSTAISDGSRAWNSLTDVPTSHGIFFDFRNRWITMKLTVKDGQTISAAIRSDSNWIQAFNMFIPDNGMVWSKTYFGITAANRKAEAENEGDLTFYGDKVTIHSVDFVVDASQGAILAQASPLHQKLRDIQTLESQDAKIAMILDVIASEVIPKQHLIHDSIAKLYHADQSLHDKIDILQALSSQKRASPQKFDELAEKVRRLIQDAHEEQAEKIGMHGKQQEDSVKELKLQSVQLATHLSAATKRNTYISLALGSVFILLVFVIFVRMKELEKKHLL